MLGNIAFGLAQLLDEKALRGIAKKLLRQLGGPASVLDHLDGLDSRQFIEEPTAARVHQHGVPLKLKQLPGHRFLGLIKLPKGVLGEKCLPCFPRAVKDDLNVIIARRPWVLEQLLGFLFVKRGQRVAQPIECGAQRGAPLLIPARMPTGVAAAVAPPAFDPVNTTPRAIIKYLDFMGGGMPFLI